MLVGKPPCSPAPSRICQSTSTRSAIVLLRRMQPSVRLKDACRPEARSGTVLVGNGPPSRGIRAQLTHLTGSSRAKPAEVVSRGCTLGWSRRDQLRTKPGRRRSASPRPPWRSRRRRPASDKLRREIRSREETQSPRAHKPTTSTRRFCWYRRSSVVFCLWERWPW